MNTLENLSLGFLKAFRERGGKNARWTGEFRQQVVDLCELIDDAGQRSGERRCSRLSVWQVLRREGGTCKENEFQTIRLIERTVVPCPAVVIDENIQRSHWQSLAGGEHTSCYDRYLSTYNWTLVQKCVCVYAILFIILLRSIFV